MAKIGSIQRNNKRKKLVSKYNDKREALKGQIKSKDLDLETRFNISIKLAKLPRNSAKNRVRNRCEITGRPRGFHRKMGLSRNKLRDLASLGMLPGIVKASW